MRLTSLILAIAIGLSVLAPAGVVYLHAGSVTVSIGTLDVCHHSSYGVNPDTPYIYECACRLFPSQSAGIRDIFEAPCRPVLVSYQDERPPESLS